MTTKTVAFMATLTEEIQVNEIGLASQQVGKVINRLLDRLDTGLESLGVSSYGEVVPLCINVVKVNSGFTLCCDILFLANSKQDYNKMKLVADISNHNLQCKLDAHTAAHVGKEDEAISELMNDIVDIHYVHNLKINKSKLNKFFNVNTRKVGVTLAEVSD